MVSIDSTDILVLSVGHILKTRLARLHCDDDDDDHAVYLFISLAVNGLSGNSFYASVTTHLAFDNSRLVEFYIYNVVIIPYSDYLSHN